MGRVAPMNFSAKVRVSDASCSVQFPLAKRQAWSR